ncbi:MAG: hypothetical protein ACTHNL_07275 [Devosia sp.]
MSLSKFLDLVTRKALFLCQLSILQKTDPFEGSLGKNRLAYLEKIIADDDFARKELHISEGKPIPEDLRASYAPDVSAWQNQRSAERTYINCWHLSTVESANLWSVYAAQGEGVAIRSTIAALTAALGEARDDLTIAPVRYVDHHTFKLGPSPEDAVFYKRLSFKSERELRLRYLCPWDRCIQQRGDQKIWAPPSGIYVPVDCDKLIQKVYISPMLGSWFRESVEAMLQRLGLEKRVAQSSINDPKIL